MEYIQNDLRWEIQKRLQAEALQDGLARWRKFREQFTLFDYERLTRRPSVDVCSHRKGAGPYESPEKEASIRTTDYNVSGFRFIDGSQRIICNRCRRKWFIGDPDWFEAVKMLEQSSNGWASNETPLYYGSKFVNPEENNATDIKE